MVLKALRELPLLTLALGVALGLSLWQVADGISDLVRTFLIDHPDTYLLRTQPLTWSVGDRFLTFGHLLGGLVQLVVVVLIAMFAGRRAGATLPRSRDAESQ